jgi:hypothetical protein
LRSRNNLSNLHLKVADDDGYTIASLSPGEERCFDLAKLNAAFSRHSQYWGIVVQPPHKDVREELFVGHRLRGTLLRCGDESQGRSHHYRGLDRALTLHPGNR